MILHQNYLTNYLKIITIILKIYQISQRLLHIAKIWIKSWMLLRKPLNKKNKQRLILKVRWMRPNFLIKELQWVARITLDKRLDFLNKQYLIFHFRETLLCTNNLISIRQITLICLIKHKKENRSLQKANSARRGKIFKNSKLLSSTSDHFTLHHNRQHPSSINLIMINSPSLN